MTVEIKLDARSALVAVLNRRYTGAGDGDEAPVAFVNDVLREIGADPVVQRVDVRAVVPVRQVWNGEIELDTYDIADSIKEAVWNDQGDEGIDEDDLEVDTGYRGTVTASIEADISAVLTVDLEIDLEDDSVGLEDAVADAVELPGRWEFDGNESITIERQFRRYA